MNENRTHRAVSADGTGITARVQGQGPPLVLLPAGPGDSVTSWRYVLPFLSESFTCYLMDTRGRGLSADHPDHSPERLVEDITAFAESIGEPVGLVDWGSVLRTLVAAEGTAAVSAIAIYEPGANEVMSEEVGAPLGNALARVGEFVAEGRLLEAARTLIENSDAIYTDEDLAGGAPSDFWEAAAPNRPVFLQEQQLAAESGRPGPTNPSVLAKLEVPVLLLHGTRTKPWFSDSVRHVAEQVADPHVREIAGAAHFGPYTEPEAIAGELARFFSHALQAA